MEYPLQVTETPPPDGIVRRRAVDLSAALSLEQSGVPPFLARLYAARGVKAPSEMEGGLKSLLHYETMKGAKEAASILADAIEQKKRLLIVGDYDTDGATASAVGVRALKMMGADVDFLVPDRFKFGYGLSVGIVHLAKEKFDPDLIITVDNGIASIEGVAEANKMGIRVVITDHHLAAETLPKAEVIVNPNQPGCLFESKNIAGVGVIFYVMLALRAELSLRGKIDARAVNMSSLLDLVAVGTVGDVVKLDANNRRLVTAGLDRIRSGRACFGVSALFLVAKKNYLGANTETLAFSIVPRLNSAGRLDDMAIGIRCLLADDIGAAQNLAADLDRLNTERKLLMETMNEQASRSLDDMHCDFSGRFSVVLYDDRWHQGIVGLIASRVKDRVNRPTIIFAATDNGREIKGSGRSIQGLHLKDALDLVVKRLPNVVIRFGGHAMAAGLTIRHDGLRAFADEFERVAHEMIRQEDIDGVIEVDEPLSVERLTLDTAIEIESCVWGQGFPPPAFDGEFSIVSQRVLGGKHLKLRLGLGGQQFDAILFNEVGPMGEVERLVYRVASNEYAGEKNLQLMIDRWLRPESVCLEFKRDTATAIAKKVG